MTIFSTDMPAYVFRFLRFQVGRRRGTAGDYRRH